MSERMTLQKKHEVIPNHPLGERLGTEYLFSRLCGNCIARCRPLQGIYGGFEAKAHGHNGDLHALAEVQCTSFLNGGNNHAELIKAYTFEEGGLPAALEMMENLENKLPCGKYPDFVKID